MYRKHEIWRLVFLNSNPSWTCITFGKLLKCSKVHYEELLLELKIKQQVLINREELTQLLAILLLKYRLVFLWGEVVIGKFPCWCWHLNWYVKSTYNCDRLNTAGEKKNKTEIDLLKMFLWNYRQLNLKT